MNDVFESACAVDESANIWSNLIFLLQLITVVWLLKTHMLFVQ